MVVVWKTVEIRFWQPVTDNVVEHPLQAQVARAQHLLVDLGVPVLDEAEGEVDIVLVVYAEAVALLWQSLALLKEAEVFPQRVVVHHLFSKKIGCFKSWPLSKFDYCFYKIPFKNKITGKTFDLSPENCARV